MRLPVPEILREHRDFRFLLTGVAFSELGTNATFTAMLYHVYALTGSTLQVGLVGLSRGIAILVLSPLGGHYADRLDRKRLLQVSQGLSLLVSLSLAILTLTGFVQVWHIVGGSLLTSAANTFDSPARKAIVPALVPRNRLVQAFALVNPTSQVGKLVGPGLAGVLIAVSGPGLVYLADTLTYVGLIVILALLHIPSLGHAGKTKKVWSSITEGFRFVRERPVIVQLIGLDVSATFFSAYRVVLPAIAVDVLRVGPTGYGLLASAVPAGALLGAVIIYRIAATAPAGPVVLATTAAFGGCAILLSQTRYFVVALVAAAGLGIFDAIGTTIRHAAVLLETPDQLRGRVSALYGMASRGAPALGQVNVGWLGNLMGASLALTIGGAITVACAAAIAGLSRTVRDYRTPEPLEDELPEAEAPAAGPASPTG